MLLLEVHSCQRQSYIDLSIFFYYFWLIQCGKGERLDEMLCQ